MLWQGEQVLMVLASSVYQASDGARVFVIDGDVVTEHQVRIGRSDGLSVQVLEGLQVGQQVVRHPDNSLVDGARVRTAL